MDVKAEVTGLYTVLSAWAWQTNNKGEQTYKKQAVPYECFVTGSEPTEASERYWRVFGFEGRPNG